MLKKLTIHHLLVIFIINAFLQIARATPEKFLEGEHFKLLRSRRPELEIARVKADQLDLSAQDQPKLSRLQEDQPEVLLFFNYGCYSCWQIHEDFLQWQAAEKKNLKFEYYPLSFNPMWEELAKLYYLNQELKSYTDQEIFMSIYKEQKKLWLKPEVMALYERKKIPANDLLKIYNSFELARKVKNAANLAEIYGVNLTPNVVLNIRDRSYMINFTMVQDLKTLIAVVKFLIENHA